MSSTAQDPPPGRSVLDSPLVRLVRRLSEITLAFIVASYAVIICTQVFYRYALNSSLVWSEEIVRFGLLWGVMIGSGVATDRMAHIALDPLAGRMGSPRAQRLHSLAVGALTIAFCGVVGWASIDYINRLWFMTSPAAHIPMRYVFAALPVGCGLIIFFVIAHLAAGTPQSGHNSVSEHLS